MKKDATDDNGYTNNQLIRDLQQQNAELIKIIENQKAELERIVLQRTKELIELVETKDKFYRIIAHELRNPFNSILGLLELLIHNFRNYDLDEIEKFLNIIYRSTNISFELLVSLSEWLNAQNNSMPFNPQNANVSLLLTDAILSVQLNANKKQLEIVNKVPDNLFAEVDTDMVSTVFRNLINNAIKFTDNNGNIEISAIKKNGFIEITVKDSGVGLSLESVKKIFKSEDIHTTLGTEMEAGTGLGLLLCKEFVEIEGGQIWVESILGQGSEFKFTLPFSKT